MKSVKHSVWFLFLLWYSACDSPQPDQHMLGSASVAISRAPEAVGCIRISVSGARTHVSYFDVTPVQPLILSLIGLPVGNDIFAGEAFEGSCSQVENTSVPTWITEPVLAEVTIEDPPNIVLVFSPNGRSNLCIDFQDGDSQWVSLTSLTLDPEDASGATTNAPGAWSTGMGDPLSQILVVANGQYLNQGAALGRMGEIAIDLQPGINTLTLFGNGVFESNLNYGAVMFFDNSRVPQIAVYNGNDSTESFSVQPEGVQIMCSPNGGSFFCESPGSQVFTAPSEVEVEVLAFNISSTNESTTDLVGFGTIWPDGHSDTVANLVLNVRPLCH